MVGTDVFLMAPIDQEPDNDCTLVESLLKHVSRVGAMNL